MTKREPADLDAAIKFLEAMRGARPWLLYCFNSDAPGRVKTETRRFSANRKAEVRAQLEVWDREDRNVYFLLANNSEGAKREKSDIVGADLVWIDIDPEGFDWHDDAALAEWQEKKRAMLEGEPPAGVPGPPHFLWSSGRGFWVAWALDRTCTDKDVLEEVNRALAAAYGGDKAHDCARVARLVGMRNAKTGRTARLVTHRGGLAPYSLEAFARQSGPAVAPGGRSPPTLGRPLTTLRNSLCRGGCAH